MGLRDFFKKGHEEPAKKPADQIKPTPPGGSTSGSIFNQQSQQQAVNQDTYTVQSGDSLSKIAKKHYGDANAWKKIYEANKQTIGDNPDLIKPGQRFVIPRT
ncbi:LysM peptidoglycan-binding domain-containing protein [Pontibacter vulgaris]|uniref:LysM peptidoglycan-binding domain-containing protein n=1 Tax=Pontibacter vulgaris TaxID=2905679 RepID=UPI001FA7F565|nr:LysM peptidoglycan-binding domain-containing protein [Pontibacter vulgaris]